VSGDRLGQGAIDRRPPGASLYAIEKAIKKEIAEVVPEDETDESVRAAIRLRIRQERAVPVLERIGK